MLNHIVLMGRLTKEPELSATKNSTNLCRFTLAVDRDYQSGGNERQTDFIDCIAWRQTAEFVSKYFHKGQMCAVSGALQSEKWNDKNGNSRVSWTVVADRVYFGGDKKPAKGVSVDPPAFEELDDGDGELPF